MDVVQIVSEAGEDVRVLVLDDGSLMAQFKQEAGVFVPLSDLVESDDLTIVDWGSAIQEAAQTETYRAASNYATALMIEQLK